MGIIITALVVWCVIKIQTKWVPTIIKLLGPYGSHPFEEDVLKFYRYPKEHLFLDFDADTDWTLTEIKAYVDNDEYRNTIAIQLRFKNGVQVPDDIENEYYLKFDSEYQTYMVHNIPVDPKPIRYLSAFGECGVRLLDENENVLNSSMEIWSDYCEKYWPDTEWTYRQVIPVNSSLIGLIFGRGEKAGVREGYSFLTHIYYRFWETPN